MQSMQFSSNVANLEPSATIALAARAKQLKRDGAPVVDMSAGEPQYAPPRAAAAGLARAMSLGETGYPPTPGIPDLRFAVARYLTDTTESDVAPASILVSAGVKQALFNCCYALFGPGDEVMIPAPYWPTYTAMADLAGASPVIVETTVESGFMPTVEQLEQHRTERTACLILNSPGNPTGAVAGLELISQLARWCDVHGIWLFSDEIYRRLSYSHRPAPSLLDADSRGERCVVFDGFSKAFCMPGFRIGFAAGPGELVKKASDLQGQTTSGAVLPAQRAAFEVLNHVEEREEFIDAMLRKLTRLRQTGIEAFASMPGIDVPDPDGALYFYGKLTDAARSCMQVAEELLIQDHVAAVPGASFGSPGWLRFNFAVQPDELEEGLGRLRNHFSRRAAAGS